MDELVAKESFESVARALLPPSLRGALPSDPDALYRALDGAGVALLWQWSDLSTFSELIEFWSVPEFEVLYVYKPIEGLLYNVREVAEAEALFDFTELVVLEPESRFIGIFHAECKHCSAFMPRWAPSVIHFYAVEDAYGELSNFAPFPINIDGRVWPTSEHYVQAQKFVGKPQCASIQKASTPMEAARAGRDRRAPLRRDWESVKRDVMRRAIAAKFTQHEDLRVLLLNTGEARLVEHTANDAYWGDGGDGRGQNWLGRLLMELRDELRRG